MTQSEVQKNLLESLKTAYRLFGQGDLMKFWLFEEHRLISKWIHYLNVYEKWFSPYRGKDIVFVEVGVFHGGSLQMWKNYFGKSAQIVGVDIDSRCKQFEEEQINIEIGSQDDPNFWATFKEKYPRVDILLDDGGHTMTQQKITFREMFPHIRDGGLYMCEDCHTSYLPLYGGGLKNPATFIEFANELIDELNAFYAGKDSKPTYNTLNIGGLHFYDSIVIAEKNFRPLPPLSFHIGERAFKTAQET